MHLSIETEFVSDPGILCGAFVARVEVSILLQDSAAEFAGVRQIARHFGRFELLALAVPRLELVDGVGGRRVAHPLDGLVVGHEVDVLHLGHVVHEPLERVEILGLAEPRRVEVHAVGRPVGRVVALEVVVEHFVDILPAEVGRAAVDHAAVVVAGLHLVHHHLPDAGIAARRTVLVDAAARVRHLVVERVRPERRIRERRHHRRVVDEAELLHHQKLAIPTDAKERHSHAAQLLHPHVRELVDDVRLADHFVEPVLDGRVPRPPLLGPAVPERDGLSENARANPLAAYVIEWTAISWPSFHIFCTCW